MTPPFRFGRIRIFLLLLSALTLPSLRAAPLPERDQRAGPPKTLNTLRTFPTIESRTAWNKRAQEIREQILVSCGLWPLPEKTPLTPQISNRVERDGYSVENVSIQTTPGFYLAGNLYRPLNRGQGPFPGILNPHGHWSRGRLEDSQAGSIAARCIQFTRMGMVAFSYDMVGYNDTAQVNHKFANDPTNQLWNINLMGLQTWNSIRALDFLTTLPDVDTHRLACTGESGGGTQTFMLGAIDNRLAAQAPIVMVSHSMQGGCLCENAPGLRIDYSNMEIAAVPAPRPQILVAATGDWTKATLTVEGPAIEKIYRLFQSAENLRYVRFDFDHNYNQTSREAVYAWFNRCLLDQTNDVQEAAYRKETDDQLRVWPERKLPADALNEPALIASLVRQAQSRWQALKPTDKASLSRFKDAMLPAWQHTLQIKYPENELAIGAGEATTTQNLTMRRLAFGRKGAGDRIEAVMITPRRDTLRFLTVLVHPDGKAHYLDNSGAPIGLAKALLEQEQSVLLIDPFLVGTSATNDNRKNPDIFKNAYTTYNRTELQERVQDLITACAFSQRHSKGRRVILCAEGRAGLWALLAAPAADGVIADCAAIDPDDDQTLLQADLFVPGLRRINAFQGAASLATPHPLFLHNTGTSFQTSWLKDTYAAANATGALRVETNPAGAQTISDWIAAHAKP